MNLWFGIHFKLVSSYIWTLAPKSNWLFSTHRSTKLIGYIMVVQLWLMPFTALWKIRFNFPREFYKAYFSPTIDRDIWIMAPLVGSLDMKLHTDSTIRADNLICKVIFAGIKSLVCENFSHFSIKLLLFVAGRGGNQRRNILLRPRTDQRIFRIGW